MNYRIFVPVRLGSSRLENKPLIEINGKTVIQRCLEQCPARPILVCPEADAPALMKGIDRSVQFALIMTEEQDEKYIHCGTDRIAVAVSRYPNLMYGMDLAINFQGDNIVAPKGAFDRLVELMEMEPPDSGIGTLHVDCYSTKHVCAIRGFGFRLVWFDRTWPANKNIAYRHVGIYAYSPTVLWKFFCLNRVLIEEEEKLEQLRWIGHGLPIYGAEAGLSLNQPHPDYGWIDINTIEDVQYAKKVLKRQEGAKMILPDFYGCERSLEEAIKKNPKWAKNTIQNLKTEIERQKDRADMFQQILGSLERTDAADRLAVIADALAEECEGLLLSCADDLEAANYWCDRADRAEAKLRALVKELDRISNDYIPDNDAMAPLALDEMREAIAAALEAAKEE